MWRAFCNYLYFTKFLLRSQIYVNFWYQISWFFTFINLIYLTFFLLILYLFCLLYILHNFKPFVSFHYFFVPSFVLSISTNPSSVLFPIIAIYGIPSIFFLLIFSPIKPFMLSIITLTLSSKNWLYIFSATSFFLSLLIIYKYYSVTETGIEKPTILKCFFLFKFF